MKSFSYLPHKNKELWEKKKLLFEKPISNIKEIKSIFYDHDCKFFDKIDKLYKNEGEEFIKIYGHLKDLALNINEILPTEIPLLKTRTKGKCELTRKQTALIFLLSFLDLIDLKQEQYKNKNFFNVSNILYKKFDSTFEFGRCFLNYLTIIGKWLSEKNDILNEKITYFRDTKEFDDKIFEKEQKLCEIKIIEEGSLFNGKAAYGVDFANKYIGGGVLGGGCVQEEILFAIEPEAIVSMFFMEVMDDNDAIRIDNTIQYSCYEGYGRDFKFVKSAVNMSDLSKIKKSKFIAIDAVIQFSLKYGVFREEDIKRDIHKAFVGFNLVNYEESGENEKKEDNNNKVKEKIEEKIEENGETEKIEKENNEKKENNEEKEKKEKEKNKNEDKLEKEKKENKENNENNEKKEMNKEELKSKEEKSISTGNWGCGAFRGDHELKFLQQWVAASFAGIERLDYYTFNSKKMKFVIKQLDKIKEKYMNANELYKDLINKKLVEEEVLEILLGEKNTDKDNDEIFSILKCK